MKLVNKPGNNGEVQFVPFKIAEELFAYVAAGGMLYFEGNDQKLRVAPDNTSMSLMRSKPSMFYRKIFLSSPRVKKCEGWVCIGLFEGMPVTSYCVFPTKAEACCVEGDVVARIGYWVEEEEN